MPYVPSSILCIAGSTSSSSLRNGADVPEGSLSGIVEISALMLSRRFSSCSRRYGSLTPTAALVTTSGILAVWVPALLISAMDFAPLWLTRIGFNPGSREFRFQSVKQAATGPAPQPRKTVLEAKAPLAIAGGGNRADPAGVAQLLKRLSSKRRRAVRLTGAVFVVDRQLLVGFQSLA